MSEIKVDLLCRDELIYELNLRNWKTDEKSVVSDLRKLLRTCLQQNIPAKSANLVDKISVRDELDTITNKLSLCEEKVLELTSESRPIDIARQNARIEHVRVRLSNLSHFTMTEPEKNECIALANKFKEIKDKFKELSYDKEKVENTVRKLSESNLEEEHLSDVFKDVSHKVQFLKPFQVRSIRVN